MDDKISSFVRACNGCCLGYIPRNSVNTVKLDHR